MGAQPPEPLCRPQNDLLYPPLYPLSALLVVRYVDIRSSAAVELLSVSIRVLPTV